MPQYVVGIDPGITGAIAILDADTHGIVRTIAMPSVSVSGKSRVSAVMVGAFLRPFAENVRMVTIEQVGAMPGQGVSSMFAFGEAYGTVKGVVGALMLPMSLITPQVWKKRAQVSGDKKAAITRVEQLYPTTAPDARAIAARVALCEAILIARFGGPDVR